METAAQGCRHAHASPSITAFAVREGWRHGRDRPAAALLEIVGSAIQMTALLGYLLDSLSVQYGRGGLSPHQS